MEDSLVPLYRKCEYGSEIKTKAWFWFYCKVGDELCYTVEDMKGGEMRTFLISVPLRFLDRPEKKSNR
jgi:hypothetical protein